MVSNGGRSWPRRPSCAQSGPRLPCSPTNAAPRREPGRPGVWAGRAPAAAVPRCRRGDRRPGSAVEGTPRKHTSEERPGKSAICPENRPFARKIGHLSGKSAICPEKRPFARKIGHLPGKSAICPENRPFFCHENRQTFCKAFAPWRPHPSKIDSGWCCPPRSRGPEGGTERRKEEN